MKTIEAECDSCSGTGLYQGMCEMPGHPVICLSCSGSGCNTIRYKPFTSRRRKSGVKDVHRSQGSFIVTGVGAVGDTISYEKFLSKEKW